MRGNVHTQFGDPSSSPQVIAVTSSLWWIHEVDLCDLESGLKWSMFLAGFTWEVPTHQSWWSQLISLSYRGNVVFMMNSQSWPLWPWKWVKVTHVQSQAGVPWEAPTQQIWLTHVKSQAAFPSEVPTHQILWSSLIPFSSYRGNESWTDGLTDRWTDRRMEASFPWEVLTTN